jgi:hypothetical protein
VSRPRREWMMAFANDRGTLTDLYAASRSCMTDACDDEPEDCGHAVNQMTPLEFVQWVEEQIRLAQRGGESALTREHKEAAARRRWRPQLEAVPA